MKGIFLKELYSINVYKKNLLFLLAVIVVMSILLPLGATYVPMMIMIYMIIIMMNLFALDDSAKWDRYALALPLSRRQIVAVRYLFLAAVTLTANLFGFLLSAVIAAIRRQDNWVPENLLTTASLVLIFLLIAAVCVPLCYRYGAEKSRMAMMVIFMILFMGFIWVLPALMPLLESLSSVGTALLAGGIAVLILAIYAGSWLLSTRIYTKKEF